MDTLEIIYRFEKTTRRYHVYRPEGDLSCNSLYLSVDCFTGKPPQYIVSRISEQAVL